MRTAASRQGYPHRKIIKQQWNNASPVFEEIVCRFSSHSHFGWCPYEDRLSRLFRLRLPDRPLKNTWLYAVWVGILPFHCAPSGSRRVAGNFSAVRILGSGRASTPLVLTFPKTAAGNFRHSRCGW
jgi:hypothetical protein